MYRSSQIIQIIFALWITLTSCEPNKSELKVNTPTATNTEKETIPEKPPGLSPDKTTINEVDLTNLRIVSTAPSTTEFLFALGLGPKIVGVSKFCNFPKEVENIPKVGGHTDPDLETIIALKPTIVVGVDSSRRKKTEDILSKSNIKSVWVKVETVKDVLQAPETLAKTFSIKHSKDSLSNRMSAQLQPIKLEKDHQRPNVLVIFGLSPMIVAGPGTYVDELVQRAGGKNIIESGPAYPQLDNEKLLALDPTLIIDVSFGDHPPLPNQLSAVKNGNVVRLENLDLMRPSPRIGEMFTFLKKAIAKASK